MIELPKKHLDDYYSIIKYIEDRMYRFILFVDDLSFEEHEVEYKHVKALLERRASA
jgi:predicted AAA+ superfamily ATPase